MATSENQIVRIKTEPGTTTPKTERLMSFKMPRDLTLGGIGATRTTRGAPKKVYTPNLNAVRNKNTLVKLFLRLMLRANGLIFVLIIL